MKNSEIRPKAYSSTKNSSVKNIIKKHRIHREGGCAAGYGWGD